MIVINCYITIAFVKYFSYKKKNSTVRNDASLHRVALFEQMIVKGLTIYFWRDSSHTFSVCKGIPYTRTSATLIASTFYLEISNNQLNIWLNKFSICYKYGFLNIYLIKFQSTNNLSKGDLSYACQS